MKFYEVNQFEFRLTPQSIEAAARTLSIPNSDERDAEMGPES